MLANDENRGPSVAWEPARPAGGDGFRPSAPVLEKGQAREWARLAGRHAYPETWKSLGQLLTTVVPLIGLWTAMMLAVDVAYWLTLLLSVPAAAFTVRLFILQHDCGHRSFFRSRRANDLIGSLIGVVTLTPHEYWRQAHNIHHATCGNLEKRGIGDITLLTVDEYMALPVWRRLAYRMYRHPVTLLVIGPIYLFVIKYRLPLDLVRDRPKLLVSVMGTNLAIAGVLGGLSWVFGMANVLMVQAPIIFLSSAGGVWLFYVQHQFERTCWQDEAHWDFFDASVLASSFYDLPAPLRWFSGNIGLHHIHHLSCRIPNYRLAACLADLPVLRTINRISLRDSLGCLKLALWDDKSRRLIPFKQVWRAAPAA